MLIRASGSVEPGFYLLTLGHSCHYLLCGMEEGHNFALFDPGPSCHLPYLARRAASLGFEMENLRCIFITHLHADRMGSVPYLKHKYPHIKVVGCPLMQNKLLEQGIKDNLFTDDCRWRQEFKLESAEEPLPKEEYCSLLALDTCVVDSDVIPIGDYLSVRVISMPGHTAESTAYFIQPLNFLIVDEGFGYYQPRALSAPGADESLSKTQKSLAKIARLEFSALCFPNMGVLTGRLVRKYLQTIIQNMEDLKTETSKAFKIKMPEEQIRQAIKDSFYHSDSADPILQHNLQRSFEALWAQLKAENS